MHQQTSSSDVSNQDTAGGDSEDTLIANSQDTVAADSEDATVDDMAGTDVQADDADTLVLVVSMCSCCWVWV